MSRAETKEATRLALIAAGLEEFATRGLDASLDTICARANLTRGAFYVHFADRDAFILAVMNHVLGGFTTVLTAARAEVGAVERALELFFTAARARAPEIHAGRSLRFFHLMDACHRSKQLGDAYRALILGARDKLVEGIAVDQAAGRVRDDVDAPALADFMTITALGVVAMFELELQLDVARLGATSRAVISGRPSASGRARQTTASPRPAARATGSRRASGRASPARSSRRV
jgi:AcrR family transcriptional regulator